MGGNTRNNPSKFYIYRTYKCYRTKLHAWIKITDFKEKQIVLIITLDLPKTYTTSKIKYVARIITKIRALMNTTKK